MNYYCSNRVVYTDFVFVSKFSFLIADICLAWVFEYIISKLIYYIETYMYFLTIFQAKLLLVSINTLQWRFFQHNSRKSNHKNMPLITVVSSNVRNACEQISFVHFTVLFNTLCICM